MKVAWLYAVWITVVAAQDGVVRKTRRGQTFTLIKELHTWNEAQDACDSIGQKMLIIRNEEESTVWRKIAETWKTEQLLITNIWAGLYDRQAGDASVTQYHWQGDCSPLGNTNMWRQDEPNHQDQDFCVRLDKANYLFRTTTCNLKCNVVCQKEGDCQFETLNHRVITVTHFNMSSPDVASCQEQCLTKDFGDTECVAFEYTPMHSLCRMALNDSQYVGNEQPATSESQPSSVYIKRCTIGYYNADTLNVVANSDTKPIDRCPTHTTISASNAGALTGSTFFGATTASVTISVVTTTTNTGIPATATSTSANAVPDPDATTTTTTATTLPPTTAAATTAGMPTVTSPTSAATATTATSATLPPSAASSITTPADITATNTTIASPTTAATQFHSTSATTEPMHPINSTTTYTRPINDSDTCNISREDTRLVCICRRQVLEVSNWKEQLRLLILEKTSLSSYRRSKISVLDERPSATSMGATGTTVIVIVVIAIAFKDFYGCCVWLLQLTRGV